MIPSCNFDSFYLIAKEAKLGPTELEPEEESPKIKQAVQEFDIVVRVGGQLTEILKSTTTLIS